MSHYVWTYCHNSEEPQTHPLATTLHNDSLSDIMCHQESNYCHDIRTQKLRSLGHDSGHDSLPNITNHYLSHDECFSEFPNILKEF